MKKLILWASLALSYQSLANMTILDSIKSPYPAIEIGLNSVSEIFDNLEVLIFETDGEKRFDSFGIDQCNKNIWKLTLRSIEPTKSKLTDGLSGGRFHIMLKMINEPDINDKCTWTIEELRISTYSLPGQFNFSKPLNILSFQEVAKILKREKIKTLKSFRLEDPAIRIPKKTDNPLYAARVVNSYDKEVLMYIDSVTGEIIHISSY